MCVGVGLDLTHESQKQCLAMVAPLLMSPGQLGWPASSRAYLSARRACSRLVGHEKLNLTTTRCWFVEVLFGPGGEMAPTLLLEALPACTACCVRAMCQLAASWTVSVSAEGPTPSKPRRVS